MWTQLLIDEFQLHSVLNPVDFVKEWEMNMAEYINASGVSALPGGSIDSHLLTHSPTHSLAGKFMI